MSHILVIGSSGTVGTELTKLLRARGETVVTATSKAAGPGSVQLDLVTGSGVQKAFDGIDKVFLLSPPGHTNQDELLGPLIKEAAKRKLKKVVLMTAMGANANEEAPMRKAERLLEAAGVPFNIIRPNWFMQNFNSYWLHGILTQNKILLPTGNAKGSFIDARDIAAVAAELLISDRFNGQDFDLTGTEALDHDQVASLISKASGRSVSYQEISPAAMLEGLLQAKLPRPYAEFLVMILGFFKAGYSEQITDSVKKITGRDPIRFAQYAQDARAAWITGS